MKLLVESLEQLHAGYQFATRLMSEQMQAVIYSDLMKLNSIIDKQVMQFREIEKMESTFKERLVSLTRMYYPDLEDRKLSILLDAISDPTDEIDRLRNDLYDQIKQAEMMRVQLMELLSFATKTNASTIRALSGLMANNYQNYTPEGATITSEQGLGINKTI